MQCSSWLCACASVHSWQAGGKAGICVLSSIHVTVRLRSSCVYIVKFDDGGVARNYQISYCGKCVEPTDIHCRMVTIFREDSVFVKSVGKWSAQISGALTSSAVRNLITRRCSWSLQWERHDDLTRTTVKIGQDAQILTSLLRHVRAIAHAHDLDGHSIRVPRCLTALSQNGIFKLQPVLISRCFVPFFPYVTGVWRQNFCGRRNELREEEGVTWSLRVCLKLEKRINFMQGN